MGKYHENDCDVERRAQGLERRNFQIGLCCEFNKANDGDCFEKDVKDSDKANVYAADAAGGEENDDECEQQ